MTDGWWNHDCLKQPRQFERLELRNHPVPLQANEHPLLRDSRIDRELIDLRESMMAVADRAAEAFFRDQYNQVRAAFVVNGTSFAAWCRSNGIDPSYGMKCVLRRTNGPAAQRTRLAIFKAAGVKA